MGETVSDEALQSALRALTEPGRLEAAQRTVGRVAPELQHILDQALHEGGWFDSAHQEQVRRAVAVEDPDERERFVRTLIAEETRLSMLIGVAVGLELANLLTTPTED